MRSHVDAHLAGQISGDIPADWLRGQGFSTCEVWQLVWIFLFNGPCPTGASFPPLRFLWRTATSSLVLIS